MCPPASLDTVAAHVLTTQSREFITRQLSIDTREVKQMCTFLKAYMSMSLPETREEEGVGPWKKPTGC